MRNGSKFPSTSMHNSTFSRFTCDPDQLAPIALFVYSRPDHTRRTVEALKNNELARHSNLFIFADGPRSQAADAAVAEVREFIRSINGFKSVTILEREHNFGLSKSIISGVSQLCEQFGRAIAVEDDVLTAPDFLTFINLALHRYAPNARVYSVCGFNVPASVPQHYPYDAFFSYRFMCWGWGTWNDRWQQVDWKVPTFPSFIRDRQQRKLFDRGGNDCSYLLARHMAGKIDSWDTIFAYAHCLHDAGALLPVASKTYNIGMEGSGTHCRRAPFSQSVLPSSADTSYRFPENVEFNPHFVEEIQRVCRRSPARRATTYLSDLLRTRWLARLLIPSLRPR
jgi:hypothetical protein